LRAETFSFIVGLMIIRKYLHSCICLEENGPPSPDGYGRASKRLLIDPGLFSFIEGKLKPEDIDAVDAILLTHSHQDHCYPEALKKILALKPAPIIAHQEIVDLLAKEGIAAEPIAAGETREVAGFSIQTLEASHEPIPSALPQNLAFLINGAILHPGDSYSLPKDTQADILLLPTFAPWARAVDAIRFAESIHPTHVIPIHDGILRDFAEKRFNGMYRIAFEPQGIIFHPLGIGDSISL